VRVAGTRDRIREFAERLLLVYSVGLLALMAASVLGLLPAFGARIAWFGFVWTALAIGWYALRRPADRARRWTPSAATIWISLLATGLFALVVRLAWVGRTDVPRGYDYGFYKSAMDVYVAALPQIPNDSLPAWVGAQFEPAILVLHQVLYLVGGITAHEHLRHLVPFYAAFALVPAYAAARAVFGPAHGLLAAALFATGLTQFATLEYLYAKNILALALFFGLIAALARHSWVAAGILLGGLGLWHRPTFLLAAIALAIVAAYDLTRARNMVGWSRTFVVSLPIFLPVWLLRFDDFFGLGLRVFERGASSSGDAGAAVAPSVGLFFDRLEYFNAAVTYLPLAMAGAALLLGRRRPMLVFTAFGLCVLDVALQFVFANRFIIMLDALAILLAPAALLTTVVAAHPRLRIALVAALLILTGVPTLQELRKEPGPPYDWLTTQQYEAIGWIRDHTPSEATILADNIDAPYVAADAGRRTYGPGLFDDPHTPDEWRRFFATTNESRIDAFLGAYQGPLFVFDARGNGLGLGDEKFHEPQFVRAHDVAGATIWSYQNQTMRL
jgi:hypothetical protein